MAEHLKTLKFRMKDKHAVVLCQMAKQVNTVWNYVNELSQRAIRERSQFMSGYELQKYTAGYTKCEGVTIRSGTVDAVCAEYATRRRQFRASRLRWRVSNQQSSKRSLGWIPVKGNEIKYQSGQILYSGHLFGLWDSYGLSGCEIRCASFKQDARGRWYCNLAIRSQADQSPGRTSVGIDLGLKTAVTTSDGSRLEGRFFRKTEKRLATAQRAGKKRQARTLHAKVRNQRKDAQHKLSTSLVQQHGAIFVGDVSASTMIKTKMAKSTHDAGWAKFKKMLEYKCHQAGVVFAVVPERYTTQTCNACGVIAGPKGRAGLNKRVWQCVCGTVHDRDVNAALNIRALGLQGLEEGAGA